MSDGMRFDNTNSLRAYPFREDQNLQDLPDNAVIDLRLIVYDDSIVPGNLVLDSITATVSAAVFSFSAGTSVITVTVSAAAVDEWYEAYTVDGAGNIVLMLRMRCGRGIGSFCETHAGDTVVFGAAVEECRTVMYSRHRVLSVQGSYAGSEKLTGGAVTLLAGYNIGLSTPDAHTVRLNAGSGLGMGIPCTPLHAGVAEDCDDYIYAVNGEVPDWFGEIKIKGGPGITVKPDPDNSKVHLYTSVSRCWPRCRDNEEVL